MELQSYQRRLRGPGRRKGDGIRLTSGADVLMLGLGLVANLLALSLAGRLGYLAWRDGMQAMPTDIAARTAAWLIVVLVIDLAYFSLVGRGKPHAAKGNS
jgi:hypothetical protein